MEFPTQGLTGEYLPIIMVWLPLAGLILMDMVEVMLLIHLMEDLPLDPTANLALVEGEALAEAGEQDGGGKLST